MVVNAKAPSNPPDGYRRIDLMLGCSFCSPDLQDIGARTYPPMKKETFGTVNYLDSCYRRSIRLAYVPGVVLMESEGKAG